MASKPAKGRWKMTNEEECKSVYRSTMYSVLIAILKDMSIEDMEWVMPRLVQYLEDEKDWRNRE